jgi:N-acetylmuramoyl-L-alanine amidase
MEMIGTKFVRTALLFFLLLSFSYPCFAKDSAKGLFDSATKLEDRLKASDDSQSQIKEWTKVVDAYRKVYYHYPSSAYCDNALFHVGALYAEMGNRFHDTLYFHRATSTYQFLVDQYTSSSLVEDAMLEYIRIMRDELKKDTEVEAMEEKLKLRSPRTAASVSQQSLATLSQPANLKSLRHYTGSDYTRIVLDFDREISFKRNRLSNPDRLYIDFDNAVAYKPLVEQKFEVDDSFLKEIRVGQNTFRKVRVVLDIKSLENFEVFSLYHPYRVVIDIQGKKTEEPVISKKEEEVPPAPLTTPEMAKANTNGNYSLARQLGLKVRRIVLDPGHGGHDPGAMKNGLREKDITLDVSLRLKKILESDLGYEVLMTRNQDEFIPLEQRTAFANSNNADLFVSVHVNSSRNRRAHGVETYYLNFATTPEAMEVAARENAIAEKNMGELQKLTAAIALNSKIEESRDFASLIQNNLVDYLKKDYTSNNLGVKQAPFYVLIGAQMPSILAEISFISNDRESTLLDKTTFRQSVAEGLAKGIRRYIETLAENKLTRNLPPSTK